MFPSWETHIPSDMCSPTWETHIPSDMFSFTRETHIPSDMCLSCESKELVQLRCKPLGGDWGLAPLENFYILILCFLHSPGYFLSKITENPEIKLCSLPFNLVGEWLYVIYKKCYL